MSNTDNACLQLHHPRNILKPGQRLQILQEPTKRIRDTYFDLHGQLIHKDIWLRRRSQTVVISPDHSSIVHQDGTNVEWEAKVRLGGKYTDSQFEEVVGQDAVAAVFAKMVPGVNLKYLKPFADLTTERQSWAVSKYPFGEVSIAIDSVTEAHPQAEDSDPFHCQVGEVEIMAEVNGGCNNAKHAGRKKAMADVLRVRLDDFIDGNKTLFPSSVDSNDGNVVQVMGKLSAYLEWKEEQERMRQEGMPSEVAVS